MLIHLSPSPRRVQRVLAWCVAGLVLAHLAVLGLRDGLGHDTVLGLARMFDLDAEQNLPSLFSSLQLLACAGVLAAIAVAAKDRRDPDAAYWAGLAAIFVLLGVDEAASIHELLGGPAARAAATAGAGALARMGGFAWVAPYAVLTLVAAVAYVRFVLRLPRATGVRVVAAGVVFVAAAGGLEVAEHLVSRRYGNPSFALMLTRTLQEVGEMASISYFLTALLRHIELTEGRLEFRLTTPATIQGPALVPESRPVPAWVPVPAPVLASVATPALPWAQPAPAAGGRAAHRRRARAGSRSTSGEPRWPSAPASPGELAQTG